MTICVFKLTKTQRICLYHMLLSANVVPMLIGLLLILISLYIYLCISPTLYSERAEISFVFIVVGMMGVSVLSSSLAGLKICWKCVHHAHKKSTRKLLLLWVCVQFYVAFWLLVLAWKSRKIGKHIIRSMKHSLSIGMINYLKDENWKIAIDTIQYQMQCCGIVGYDDWHNVSCFHPETHDWKLPITPWSCCKITFPMQCLHDPLQQTHSLHIWTDEPNLVTDSLNIKGCLSILRVPIETAITFFILLAFLNLVCQIIIFLMTRILYTSCRNALILQDPKGTAPGWIFGRGDCGIANGKTLAEIMESETQSSKNTMLSSETGKSDKSWTTSFQS